MIKNILQFLKYTWPIAGFFAAIIGVFVIEYPAIDTPRQKIYRGIRRFIGSFIFGWIAFILWLFAILSQKTATPQHDNEHSKAFALKVTPYNHVQITDFCPAIDFAEDDGAIHHYILPSGTKVKYGEYIIKLNDKYRYCSAETFFRFRENFALIPTYPNTPSGHHNSYIENEIDHSIL